MTPCSALLVHGSMHGAWCWQFVLQALARRGVPATAIDLPGHGARVGEASSVTLDAYAAAVLAEVDAAPGTSVLVGHSMAGPVVSRVASERPQRIHHLVFLNAHVLLDGESAIGTLPPELRARYHELALAHDGLAYRIDDDEAHARWMQDLPREHPLVTYALERLTPQPMAPLLEPVRMQGFHGHGVPATYIRSVDDVGASRERTERFVARLPFDVPVVHIPGGHDAMLSQPEAVARVIASAVDVECREGADGVRGDHPPGWPSQHLS